MTMTLSGLRSAIGLLLLGLLCGGHGSGHHAGSAAVDRHEGAGEGREGPGWPRLEAGSERDDGCDGVVEGEGAPPGWPGGAQQSDDDLKNPGDGLVLADELQERYGYPGAAAGEVGDDDIVPLTHEGLRLPIERRAVLLGWIKGPLGRALPRRSRPRLLHLLMSINGRQSFCVMLAEVPGWMKRDRGVLQYGDDASCDLCGYCAHSPHEGETSPRW